jgi:hypothetical protein
MVMKTIARSALAVTLAEEVTLMEVFGSSWPGSVPTAMTDRIIHKKNIFLFMTKLLE